MKSSEHASSQQVDLPESEKRKTRKPSVQLNDETIIDADGMAMSVRVMDEKHESVIEGMMRLRRACQVNKVKLDQIENLLFEDEGKEYDFSAKVTIQELMKLLKKKLQSSDKVSFDFARYLIEQNDQTLYQDQTGDLIVVD